MKKLFLSMLAAVTLFASCSQEEIVTKTDGESLVSFTVTTPELGSRAVGDGATAKNLYYAVYDETTSTATIVEAISKDGTNNDDKMTMPDSKKTTINLPLLNGHKYSLLFWAESANGAYEIDFPSKSISLKTDNNFTLTSNKEDYDAFYAYVEPFVVTGDKHSSVELKRPFAQLNIGTTLEDITRVGDYFVPSKLTETQIVVENVPTSMNLATGTLTPNERTSLTYTSSAFDGLNESAFPVDGFQYISMNYILVGKSEKTLVDVTLTTDIEDLEPREYKNVPLQGNYRTNIYGELFTSLTNWDVEIEDEFETPAYEVLDGVIELEGDMTINESFHVENSLAINLNGHKLSYEGDDIMIRVEDGAKLTFNGPGEVVSTNHYIASVNKGGEIYVNGGSYTGSTTCFNVNGGSLYITGGTFNAWNKEYEGVYTLNHKDGTGGNIVVTGGEFYKYDPNKSNSESPVGDFVPVGYSSVQVGDYFVVAKGTAVADNAALTTALANGGEVSIVTDIESDKILKIEKETTVYLYGNKFTSTAKKAFEVYANATFKDGTIEGVNRCVDTRKAVEVTLENVTLIADKYTSEYENPQPLTIGGSENGTAITLKNSTISAAAGYGIISFVEANVIVTNSTISGYNALYVKDGSDNSTFNFVKSTLKGSTKSNDVEGNSFSTIALRANITVNVDKDSKVIAEGNYCSALSFVSKGFTETSTNSKITLAGTIEGDILDGPATIANNEIYVNATYKATLETEFTCTDSGNGLIKVTAK